MNAVLSIGVEAKTLNGYSWYVDDFRVMKQFTGDADDKWTHHTIHSADAVPGWTAATATVCTNGVDAPVHFDGDDFFEEFYIETVTDFPSFQSTRLLAEHFDHLIFYDFTTGVRNSRSMKWTTIGEVYGSASDAWSTGTFGEKLLTSLKGEIKNIKKLKNSVLIYGSDSILEQIYIGGLLIYKTGDFTNELGLLTTRALQVRNDFHFFLGSDQNFYTITANGGLQDIGSVLGDDLVDNLNFSATDQIIFAYNRNKKRIFCCYPDNDLEDSYAQSFYVLNLEMSPPVWEEGRFGTTFRGMTLYENEVVYTCEGDSEDDWAYLHTCDESGYAELSCGDASLKLGFPAPAFIDTVGQAYMIDGPIGTDAGQTITGTVITKDFTAIQLSEVLYMRPIQFSFNAGNIEIPSSTTTLAVSYSTDEGANWTAFDDSPITLAITFTEYMMEFPDIKVQRVRFKFVATGEGDFQLGDMMYYHEPSTVRE
jgi:hypothetical protein